MTKAVMLDTETLNTAADSVILTLGAVQFDPYSEWFGDTLYLRFEVDSQFELGRTANEDTVNWWGQQDPAVRDEALGDSNRIPLEDCISQLNKFLVGTKQIWAQGPQFDITMLEHLYRQLNTPVPWLYWEIFDSRTLFNSIQDFRIKDKSTHHNALEDSVSQALALQELFKSIGVTSKRD
jgi:hypothetical protein